jgi:hypothetical protein
MMDRFMKKVNVLPHPGCWLWKAGLNTGYGELRVGDTMLLAHRISFEHHIGEIPEGYIVHHECEVRRCVNPNHLVAIPRGEHPYHHGGSFYSGYQKTHCPYGHAYTDYGFDGKRNRQRCKECDRIHHSLVRAVRRDCYEKSIRNGARKVPG